MISQKTYEESIETLKKLGFNKSDYSKVNFNDIYFNFLKRTDLNVELLSFEYKDPNSWQSPFYELGNQEYENENEKYRFWWKTKDIFTNWDFYLIPNEYFGYDSTRLDFLTTINKTLSKFPNRFAVRDNGLKQTLLFVNKKPVDGKAEFFYYPSLYPHFIYGDKTIQTREFFLSIKNIIENIFGLPIINHWKIPNLEDKRHWNYGIMRTFEKYIAYNNIKQISIKEVYEQKNAFGKYEEYFINHSNNKIGNLEWNVLNIDFVHMITYYISKIFTGFSFWNNKDIPHLKFFLLDDEYLNVANIKKKTEFNYYESWDITKILEFREYDNFYVMDMNILFSSWISQPILIIDQKNDINVLYKIIVPYDLWKIYDKNDAKIFIKKILDKAKDFKEIAEATFDISKILLNKSLT